MAVEVPQADGAAEPSQTCEETTGETEGDREVFLNSELETLSHVFKQTGAIRVQLITSPFFV